MTEHDPKFKSALVSDPAELPVTYRNPPLQWLTGNSAGSETRALLNFGSSSVIIPLVAIVVTTSTKSPALLQSQFVNSNTTFGAEPKQPSSATGGIYPSNVETARTDDDLQGFESDNASDI